MSPILRGESAPATGRKEAAVLLLIILLILLLAAYPTWPHSRNWGYYPSGGLGLLLVVLIVLMLCGLMPWGYW